MPCHVGFFCFGICFLYVVWSFILNFGIKVVLLVIGYQMGILCGMFPGLGGTINGLNCVGHLVQGYGMRTKGCGIQL